MRFFALIGAAAAIAIGQVGAFRSRSTRKIKKAAAKAEGSPETVGPAAQLDADGTVGLLYTYGAPSLGKPAIQNTRSSDGCFPGRRFWNSDANQVDIVPPLPNIVGYRHPYMDGVDLDVGQGRHHTHPCSEENTDGPPGRKKADLHSRATYVEEASKLDDLAENVSQIGLDVSYVQDEQEAAAHVSSFGWGLVHTAFHEGSWGAGGPQVSHLIQNPHNNECIITFQGTDSWTDWLADIQVISVDFCGLESQVHRGFRNHLRRMVKTDVFQNNIRPYLPSCSKVIATGHSLGGAMATLYTACLASAPPPGSEGWEKDYQYMRWTQGTSSRMNYIKSA